MIVGSILSVISILALWKLKETFHTDLNYIENDMEQMHYEQTI
jgi:putative MFS transporter